jgi:hypothetical protein
MQELTARVLERNVTMSDRDERIAISVVGTRLGVECGP